MSEAGVAKMPLSLKSILQTALCFVLSGALVLIGLFLFVVSLVALTFGHSMSPWVWGVPLGLGVLVGLFAAGRIWFERWRERSRLCSSEKPYYAKVSPPPYGGKGDKVEVRREQ